ncbi:hypothetical protein V5O48_007788 [Marasmius crinis-equi]|uniref:Uncharacterized protein n=1 Tax=Marasmius crinis-equi TaxID=585013 RepID=A0ABR3FFP3_9AGAR
MYEKVYYQYTPSRLPVCTLPAHGLLHIADDILNAGPAWCYWNFVTERFCGFLTCSSKTRKNSYASFARRLREVAQLNQIKHVFHLSKGLDLLLMGDDALTGHQSSGYPDVCLLTPRSKGPISSAIQRALARHPLVSFKISSISEATRLIPPQVTSWGKLRYLGGGDTIHS